MISKKAPMVKQDSTDTARDGERGAALATVVIIMAMLLAISVSVMAVVSTEANTATSDLQRARAFYAAEAGIEKMTSDFSAVFERKSKPSPSDLTTIEGAYPSALASEGFTFTQNIDEDTVKLADMRASANPPITNGTYPRVTIPSGPFAGLVATVSPYLLESTATLSSTGTQVKLQREMNNYLIPLFQFGMFSDSDLEIHPGAEFYFNGRVHCNGNLYAAGLTKFMDKVTTANEFVLSTLRNGGDHSVGNTQNVRMQVGTLEVPIKMGSVTGGPNLPGTTTDGQRGYFPDSPNGTDNSPWKTTSIAQAQAKSGSTTVGVDNQLGGQMLTRTTGAVPLYLPLQLAGNPTREIIKRRIPGEETTEAGKVLSDSRYHSKAQIRILIDDEGKTDSSGIPSTKGVDLSTWVPTRLGNKVLHRYADTGTDVGVDVKQSSSTGTVADSVRGINSSPATTPKIPIGAGSALQGRILIEIVPPNGGAPVDVTQTILSMGVTEGEPNGIVYLQRPLWAAFMQGSRDRGTLGGLNNLVDLIDSTDFVADGEFSATPVGSPTPGITFATSPDTGYIASFNDDDGATKVRNDTPSALNATDWWNAIVPINVYNVREGWTSRRLASDQIYERGVTSVVEINMQNLSRWVSGFYDSTLLSGNASAKSTNIDLGDGYIIYVSDRRGDVVRSGATNGMVDNEDIYIFRSDNTGSAVTGQLDPGEDINGDNVLQRDTSELTDPNPTATITAFDGLPPTTTGWTMGNTSSTANRLLRAREILSYKVTTFRRAVRLFNGENLDATGTNMSLTRGMSISTENMVYIWGNYNTTGITCQPSAASTMNEPPATEPCKYTGTQVPASIVSDAFFPLSKTWADSLSAMYPEGGSNRDADAGLPSAPGGSLPNYETAVRAGIIAGNNMSAMAAAANSAERDAGNGGESRLCGGMHNFPRFLEDWGGTRWNLVGALAPLYRSTQAVSPYNASGVIYGAPIRNWAFDTSFRDPSRLPPGTPAFQYIEPTAFRQIL
jgi:hypothetical protein